ncbi:endonuclease [Amaricoccus sp.]|uniref:endonuclease n=1 Tax=Amaricoccus sp. TaxID=1872485 RepID=UPI002604DE59|nr:endonuclease [Amaricoccus sp.]HRO12782.1 endonuclease [Amaricoccus sp.]
MAASQSENSGVFWSLVSWVAAIVGAIVVGLIVGKILHEAAGGIIFAGVTFIILGFVLSRLIGPSPADDGPGVAAGYHAAPAPAAPLAGPVASPAPAPVTAPPAAPAPDAGAISERVRDAARAAGEAARAALGDAAPAPAASGVAARRPAALAAPLEGGADNLMRLKGVGPKLAELLNANGVHHFSQIAAWGPAEIEWIESNLEGFTGRVVRDDWVGQAKILAAGGETEHSQRVDRGEST